MTGMPGQPAASAREQREGGSARRFMATAAPCAPRAFPSSRSQTAEWKTRPGPGRSRGQRWSREAPGSAGRAWSCSPGSARRAPGTRRSAGAVPGGPGRAATSGRRGGWAGSSSTGMASVASPGRTSPGFSGVRAGSALGAGPGTRDPELKSRGQASRRSGAEGARRSAGTAGRAGKAVRAEGGGGPGSSPRKGGCFRVFPGRGKGRTQPRGQQGGLLGSAVWPRGEGAAGLKVGPSFGLKTKGHLVSRAPGTHTGLGSGGPSPGLGGPCGG